MGKIVAVIPSNRPEFCREAVKAWAGHFDEIWVVWDSDQPVTWDKGFGPDRLFTFDGKDWTSEGVVSSGELNAVIPVRSSCCRSLASHYAWNKRPDVEWIVCLDDDVRPLKESTTWKHEVWAAEQGTPHFSYWRNTIGYGIYPRGHPYGVRAETSLIKVIHGVWNGMPDLDAAAQLQLVRIGMDKHFEGIPVIVPRGQYFAMSSMNVAIHRDLFPALYFLWMGWNLPLNKYGDIWCGVILKRICDHLGWACVTGAPVVQHDRVSDVWKNLRSEATTIEYNENWWRWVDAVPLTGCVTVTDCYQRIVQLMEMPDEPKFETLREKMVAWVQLFVQS